MGPIMLKQGILMGGLYTRGYIQMGAYIRDFTVFGIKENKFQFLESKNKFCSELQGIKLTDEQFIYIL